MPDPVSTEAVVAGAAAGGGGLALFGRMMWGIWRGWKETSRDDRRTAQADKAESDTIKRLEVHIARMEQTLAAAEARHTAEMDRLSRRIAEQDSRLEEMAHRLDDALDGKVKAMTEAAEAHARNAQLEASIQQSSLAHGALLVAHEDLVGWLVEEAPTPDEMRGSRQYMRAKAWLRDYRQAKLSETAA